MFSPQSCGWSFVEAERIDAAFFAQRVQQAVALRARLYLHIDPTQLLPLPANGRDVSQQGHWGTGDLELALTSQADLDAAKPLILMAYEGRSAFAATKSAPASGS